jgi:hypothetical protein
MLQNRSYFFNVKENRMGDLYLNIVESKNKETGGFDRQSVILFADDLQEFLQGFDESLRVLEKAVREKRRTTGGESRGGESRGGRRPPSAPREAPWKTEGPSGDRDAKRVVVRRGRITKDGGSGYKDGGPRSRDAGSGGKGRPAGREGGRDNGPSGAPGRAVVRKAWKKD